MKTCRKKNARRRWAAIRPYVPILIVFAGLLLIGFVSGFAIGRVTAEQPEPAEVVQEEVEPSVPAVARGVEPEEPAPLYTDKELELLALIIYQEAGGDAASDDTRQMVGEVVLNRVADDRFPDTIEEVLLQPKQYGFTPETGIHWPTRRVHELEAHAVERAYECAEELLSGEAERLLPPDAIWQAGFVQGTEVLVYQDGLYFCR